MKTPADLDDLRGFWMLLPLLGMRMVYCSTMKRWKLEVFSNAAAWNQTGIPTGVLAGTVTEIVALPTASASADRNAALVSKFPVGGSRDHSPIE